eukprot:scaffold253990_cov31-Tisochrysis_lutea.AAC.4
MPFHADQSCASAAQGWRSRGRGAMPSSRPNQSDDEVWDGEEISTLYSQANKLLEGKAPAPGE